VQSSLTRRRARTAFAVVISIGVLAVAACGSEDEGGPVEGGDTYTVLTSADFPPLSFRQEGQIVGFEFDMVKAIMGHLNLKYRVETGEFSGLVPAVQGGRADFVVSDVYNTEERRQAVDFVDYLANRFSVMVRAADKGRVKDFTDLCGKRVGILTGSEPEKEAIDRGSAECEKAGEPPIEPRSFPNVAQELPQLRSGGIDGILETYTVLDYTIDENPGQYAIAFDDETTEAKVGAIFAKGSEMRKRFAEGLRWYIDSGGYKRDADKWKLAANTRLDGSQGGAQ
jgi:ABC-type amino acid transport substrate-binding protein